MKATQKLQSNLKLTNNVNLWTKMFSRSKKNSPVNRSGNTIQSLPTKHLRLLVCWNNLMCCKNCIKKRKTASTHLLTAVLLLFFLLTNKPWLYPKDIQHYIHCAVIIVFYFIWFFIWEQVAAQLFTCNHRNPVWKNCESMQLHFTASSRWPPISYMTIIPVVLIW